MLSLLATAATLVAANNIQDGKKCADFEPACLQIDEKSLSQLPKVRFDGPRLIFFQMAWDQESIPGPGCMPASPVFTNGENNYARNRGLDVGNLDPTNRCLFDDQNTRSIILTERFNSTRPGWFAQVFYYYSPKDQFAAIPFSGHRHDWEHAVIWYKDNQPYKIGFSAHGKISNKVWNTKGNGSNEVSWCDLNTIDPNTGQRIGITVPVAYSKRWGTTELMLAPNGKESAKKICPKMDKPEYHKYSTGLDSSRYIDMGEIRKKKNTEHKSIFDALTGRSIINNYEHYDLNAYGETRSRLEDPVAWLNSQLPAKDWKGKVSLHYD